MGERDVLDSWKAICDYLKVDRRTAERRADKGMPVWGKGRRFAYTDQLDFWLANGRRRLEPVTANLSGNLLTTYYDTGQSLWMHRFSSTLDIPEEAPWLTHVGSVGTHTGKCVLAVCRLKAAPDRASSSELFCFAADGTLLWSVPAEPELFDRDGRAFPKAWLFTYMIVDAPGPDQSIWLSFANEAGWAGGVLRVDAHGSAKVQFANAGHVESLGIIDTDGDHRILLCGENNDFDQAFVGWFGANDPPASSPPGKRPPYRYRNGPSGSPRKYILFPQTELIKARDKPYGHAFALQQFADDIIIDVETGGEGGYFRYHFSTRLEPAYVFPSGSHEFRHRTLEGEGRIDHPWQRCPEIRSPLDLAIWEPESGWRVELIRWRDTYPADY